jgi:hypothetical protein
MSLLESYWPTDASVRDCLKSDAEAADPAVLLAVHQPMRFRRRDFGTGFEPHECTEEDVLRALLAETGDGRIIVPIVGDSGVGKSHVIRWLDARLQHAAGAERRVVHRISKGQSLRRIVSALLDRPELSGERFAKIRIKLETARERLSDSQAANLLCEVLAQTVGEASEEAGRRIARGEVTPALKLQRDFGKELPALLREPSLRALQWVERPGGKKGCIGRLVEQFTTSVEADQDDDRKHKLEPSDLVLDNTVDLKRLSNDAQHALSVLQLHREDRRSDVATVLNSSLDDAKRQVLGLETSISALFDEVRRQLLAEGKELVLLIEDFALLSGMQKELLQVAIREGFRDGRQVFCTLRTALAYTEGGASFLFDDTYRSRAKAEWLVPETGAASDKDLDRVVRLVAAYLNAARVGVEGLRRALEKARESGVAPDATRAWIPHYPPPESGSPNAPLLDAFGVVEDNYLFPFNLSAIARLVEEGCKKGQDKVYNPRLILQRVLHKVLERRHEFLSRSFPGNDFRADRYRGHPKVLEKVATLVGKNQLERCVTVLAYWYEDCRTWEALEKKSPKVFEAFGLSAPWAQKQVGESPPVLPLPPGDPLPPEPPPPPPPLPRDEDLRKWSEGQSLGFDRARKIRRDVAKALDGSIQWDWFCAKPRRTITECFESVLLPRADGGVLNLKPAEAVAAPWTEQELDDLVRGSSVLGQVKALERYFEDESWDYDKPERDAARYCALLESTWSQAATFLVARPLKEREDFLPTLVSGLAIGARAFGVPGADTEDHVALVAALLHKGSPVTETVVTATGWLQAEKAMARWRGLTVPTATENWQSALLRLVGARQGGGSPLAINVSRLKPALDEVVRKWNVVSPPPGLERFVDPQASVASGFNLAKFDLTRALADEAVRVGGWAGRVADGIGSVDGVEAVTRVCDAVKDAVHACQDAGHATRNEANDILVLNDTVRSLPVAEFLNNARQLAAAADSGSRLRFRARHDTGAELVITRWLQELEKLFVRVEGTLPAASAKGAPDPVALARDEFATTLDALATEFERGAKL